MVDLPGVGQKLMDHPIVDLFYTTKSDARSIQFLRPESLKERFKFLQAMMQYFILGVGGPMAMNVCSLQMMLQSLINQTFFFIKILD